MSKVKISTAKGDMVAELYDNETPITVKNFLDLIEKGFYNGLNFHRVIPSFVIQSTGNKKGGVSPLPFCSLRYYLNSLKSNVLTPSTVIRP